MYLTRIRLHPRRRKAHEYLTNPQTVHAAVLAGSPTQPIPQSPAGRVLWRIDRDNPHQPLLYVLTPEQYDATHIVEQAGYAGAPDGTVDTAPYTPLLDRINPGARFAFRLTANPVRNGRCAGDGPGSATRRFGHVTVDQQLAWLTARAERHGFELLTGSSGAPDVVVRDRRRLTFRRNGARVAIATATYDGHLTVTDPERLRHTLTHGIGHARAYGCGLLTLAPTSPQARG